MKRNNKYDFELLAPAGSPEAFIAAVENGADAVYIGGRAFNARINAGNFDNETMQKAFDYAHKRGVKVYVTMNTLLCDSELEEAAEYADFLYAAGADALIIQDLGFGNLIRKRLPDFPRHLSTQATVADTYAVKAAGKLGYERVVLARELSLDEIRKVCELTPIEIEVFVHGALCICYSGQCQMSRYYGGRSGNRGACAQPCRLPYEGEVGGRKTSGHLLSPKDLCGLDSIGDLIEAGVRSFKIEGRMKSPEYVAVVTKIYRKYIDLYIEKGSYSVDPEDRRALEQIFNRGGFTRGYINEEPGEELMSPEIPKNRGIAVGVVESVKRCSKLIDISAREDIRIGDGIEIRGADGRTISNIMTYKKEVPGGLTRIGDFREGAKPGDKVFRTSSKNQLESAALTFRNASLEDDPETRKIGRRLPIDMTLTCFDGKLELTASAKVDTKLYSAANDRKTGKGAVSVKAMSSAGPFERDFDAATPEERYKAAVSKTGSTPFEVRNLRMKGNFDIRIKASEINALRRECLKLLEKELCFRRMLPESNLESNRIFDLEASHTLSENDESGKKFDEPREEIFFHTLADFERLRGELTGGAIVFLPLADLFLKSEEEDIGIDELFGEITGDRNGNTNLALYISNVSTGKEDSILDRHLEEIAGLNFPVYAGNLGWLMRLGEAGAEVYADSGLNVCNDETLKALEGLGACGRALSLEADKEQVVYGVFPLMTTKHAFAESEMRNRERGMRLKLIKRKYSDHTLIVPEKKTLIDKKEGRTYI